MRRRLLLLCSAIVALQLLLRLDWFASRDADVELVINAVAAVVDEQFVCATLDLWPPEKCNAGTCPWHRGSSFLTADLPPLLPALKALRPLTLRLGGSLADHLHYGDACTVAPPGFGADDYSRFGFGDGCLTEARWVALNELCAAAGCSLVLTLNALTGRRRPRGCRRQCLGLKVLSDLPMHAKRNAARRAACCFNRTGAWDASEARALLGLAARRGWRPRAVAYGNEVAGEKGLEARLSVETYAEGLAAVRDLLRELWPAAPPTLIAPDGNFDAAWMAGLVRAVPFLDALAVHVYAFGAGGNPHVDTRLTDPEWMDGSVPDADELRGALGGADARADAAGVPRVWVSEAGGVSNSGRANATDVLLSSFWYADALGLAARRGVRTFCRQTLVGGHYGLLRPGAGGRIVLTNPDFWVAWFWRRLMGRTALDVGATAPRWLRVYAHCGPRGGIALCVVNVDANRAARVSFGAYRGLAKNREEYHIAAGPGGLRARDLRINGEPSPTLAALDGGAVPRARYGAAATPLRVAPLSIVFVSVPRARTEFCE
jgi:heparanase 1